MALHCHCSSSKRTADAQLLALLHKRRRLGYQGRSMKKLILGLLMGKQCSKCHLESGKPQRRARRWWQRPILQGHDEHGAWATLIPLLREDEDLFFNFMRMTSNTFDSLLHKVSPFLVKKSWRKSISPGERLAIALRYIASGDSYMSLMYLFRVSPQVISKIVLETTTVVWHVLKTEVFPELTEEFWLKTAAEFEVMWNIPHCVGAIDGKQVYVKAFPHCGSRYYGYKKRHCMTFMAVADAKHKFVVVESGASGKRADANIFHRSTFAHKLREGKLNLPPECEVEGVEGRMPFFFVGDNAYPRSNHLATPFKGKTLRDEELVYNYRLSRARRIVENAFGILTARFRILFRPIEGSRSLVKSIILCCLALHNFHLNNEESVPPKRRKYLPEGFSDYVEGGKLVYGRWRNENVEEERALFCTLVQQTQRDLMDARKGKKLSEMLLHYFVFNAVPWQWEKANLL